MTEEVQHAKKFSQGPEDPWEDYIDWKTLQSIGYTHVEIDSELHKFNKWGLCRIYEHSNRG